MRTSTLSIGLCLSLLPKVAGATTWDEPWQEEVVRSADVFLLATISSVDKEHGLKLKVKMTLAGDSVAERIRVTGFHLLDLCSMSGGHGPEFHFRDGDQYYFFLQRDSVGNYTLPTPTSGWAEVKGGNVYATYRHSYHQAFVPEETYRWTMTAIFQHVHGMVYDRQRVAGFIQEQLALPVGHLEIKNEEDRFFLQHVALEMLAMIPVDQQVSLLEPFLNDTGSYHGMISACRALGSLQAEPASTLLLAFLDRKDAPGFPQVMAVYSLRRLHAPVAKDELAARLPTASDDQVGFGGNLMDPRVCTHLPSVRAAIAEALKDW